jgi:hypothetical protein
VKGKKGERTAAGVLAPAPAPRGSGSVRLCRRLLSPPLLSSSARRRRQTTLPPPVGAHARPRPRPRPWPPRRPRLSALATSGSTFPTTPPPLRPACPRPPPPPPPPLHRSGAGSPSPRARKLGRGRGLGPGTWRHSGPGCPCTSHAPTTCSSPTPRAPSPAPSTTARPASRFRHYLLTIVRFLVASCLLPGLDDSLLLHCDDMCYISRPLPSSISSYKVHLSTHRFMSMHHSIFYF